MSDFNIFPARFANYVQIFTPTTGVNVQGFQRWKKPRGCSMVQMFCIAGGGGGGGGASGATAGGGGGGACSGLARFTGPAILLPDELFIQVGAGGLGGAPDVNGAAGLNSYILTSITPATPNIILYSNASAPGGGAKGTTGGAGIGGSVPTIAVTQPSNTWGQWFATVGIVGAAGGAHTGAVGVSVTAWAAIPLSQGAGGAGCTAAAFNGGAVTATALLDIQNQGYYPTGAGNICKAGTGEGAAINGSSFAPRLTPFFNAGGAGGGSSPLTVEGGNGGNGGYGCGGGGGGGGGVTLTGGRGGNGGSGLILILAW